MRALKNNRLMLLFLNTIKTIQNFIVVFLLMVCGFIQAQSITELEYYFGNDPGVGNGNLVTATANSGELTQTIGISLAGLPSGFHRLTLRAKDDVNIWSLYDSNVFYISEPASSNPIANLAAAEYWFDNDPGPGNATALTITGNPSETVENFAIPLGSLEAGFHNVGLRIQDTDGIWSLYDRRAFYIIEPEGINPIANLAAAEYWFDNDPGPGNGTALAITGNPSETIENFVIPLGSLEAGFHKVGLRIQNLDDTWSLYDIKTFYIIDPVSVDSVSPLTEAEFLFDAELGFGTGTAVAITATGNPNEYLIEIPTDIETCGLHNISLSVRNELGNYSLYQITTNTDLFDDLPPTIVVFPSITAELDASGQASISITDVDNGTFDDCELVSVVLNQTQFDYTCANLGANTVTVTATDIEAKVSTLDVTITVVDNINPVAIGQDITIDLNGNPSVSIIPSDVNNGSNDNCNAVTLSVDVDTFTVIGDFPVTLTATDSSGNTDSFSVIITVIDGALSIEDEELAINNIILYPVPTSHYLNFSTSLLIDTIEIFDINGKKVISINNPDSKIDVLNLESGVYFLKFYSDNKSVTKKIIKK